MALRAPLVIVDGRVQQLQVGDTLSDVQPLDADLTAIAALSDTGGWAKRTGADTWAISTPTAADVSADPAGTAAAAVATHESTYSHANYNTAYGWGDHASGGYLKADGTVPLTGDWTTGIFSIVGSDHWYLRADSMKLFFGAGDDCSVMYNGTNMVFNSQEVGTGGFYFANGTIGIGTVPLARIGLNVNAVSVDTASSIFGLASTITYGAAASGNTAESIYGLQCSAKTGAAYDGNVTGVVMGAEFIANHYGTGTLSAVDGGRFRIVLRADAGDIVDAVSGRFNIENLSITGATITNAYGLYVDDITAGSTLNYAIYTNAGEVRLGGNVTMQESLYFIDNKYAYFGTGNDAQIYYSGVDLVIKPRLVGNGALVVNSAGGLVYPIVNVYCPADHALLRITSGGIGKQANIHFVVSGQGWYFGCNQSTLSWNLYDATHTTMAVRVFPKIGAAPPHMELPNDNAQIFWGAALDCSIMYDGTNMIVNPANVGTGILDVLGVIQTDGYNSADGTAGATAGVAVAKVGGGTRTLTFKNGLYISYADS